jgi:uncharacterized membrane protein YfcA
MGLAFLIGMLGLVCGFLSGLLGIGGGIIMAPLLLYMPPLFGFDVLSMHTVAGLTIVQGLVACGAGALAHNKFHCISGKLTVWMGITIFLTALTGGALAKYVENYLLLLLFGILALIASILMFLPIRHDPESPDVTKFSFSRWRAVAASGSVGLLGGLVGQGGSFILIPLMISFVRIPTRIAVGSNLAIVLLSTTAAFLGKALTGQIVWFLTLPIILTVIPAASFGGRISHMIPTKRLRQLLAVVIAIAAARLCVPLMF